MLWSSDYVIWLLKQLSVRLRQFVKSTQEHGFIFSLLHPPLHQHPHCRYDQCTDQHTITNQYIHLWSVYCWSIHGSLINRLINITYSLYFIIYYTGIIQVWSVLHSLHFTDVLFCSSDGFLEYRVERCEFNSTALKHIEYIYSRYYKKIEYIRFSSSVGKYVGFTEHGVELAMLWNNNTARLNSMRQMVVQYCYHNIDVHDRAVLAKSGECVVAQHHQGIMFSHTATNTQNHSV